MSKGKASHTSRPWFPPTSTPCSLLEYAGLQLIATYESNRLLAEANDMQREMLAALTRQASVMEQMAVCMVQERT